MTGQQLLPHATPSQPPEEEELREARRAERSSRRRQQRRARLILWTTIGTTTLLLSFIGFFYPQIPPTLDKPILPGQNRTHVRDGEVLGLATWQGGAGGWAESMPCPAIGRMGEACQRDTPTKTGGPGPSANTQTRQGGGASAGPARTRSSLCALADMTW